MENEKRITWVSGPATGFYIDFDTQKMGYSGKEKGLTRLQTRLLLLMLTIPGGIVTAGDTSKDPELFSIDFSKYISAIKAAVKSLLKSAGRVEDTALFIDQIFIKRGTYGSTGYGLRTELTDAIDEITSVRPDPLKDQEITKESGPVTAAPSTEPSEPGSHLQGFKQYINLNWLPLFIYFFLILGIILLLDSLNMPVRSLLANIVDLPFGFTFLGICILSALPILGGLFIDVPLALKQFEKQTGTKRSELDADSVHKVCMFIVPRFDNSKAHVIFFLLCNLTGAFSAASVLLYFKSIPGIRDFMSVQGKDFIFAIIIAVGCLVALYNNFSLQTSKSSTRLGENYILSRAHAFLNLIYLSVIMPLGGSLIYLFLSYRFFYNGTNAVITSSYVVMVIASYCYLWFSSDSPAAQKIDSISKNNFITGLPFVAVITTAYTVLCFSPNPTCVIALLTAPAFLLLWLVCFLKRKKENTIKLYYFVSSFFSILAITVIVMLALSFRL